MKMQMQVKLNKAIQRLDQLIVLHTNKSNSLKTKERSAEKPAPVSPLNPIEITDDTIKALEVLKAVLMSLENDWIVDGKLRKITALNLIFNAELRRLATKTVEMLAEAARRIVNIYTTDEDTV